MHAAPDLDALLRSLPGQVRRGHAPASAAPASALRIPSGLAPLDRLLDGGIPRGHLSEILARGSAGGTSLAQRLAAGITRQGGLVSWVDPADTFDPASAAAVGIDLSRLLWARPPDLEAGLRATEALLSGGGFPLVLLDARVHRPSALQDEKWSRERGRDVEGAHVPRRPLRGSHVRPHVWMRLARAAARSQSALVVLQPDDPRSGHGSVATSAALCLRLAPLRAVWDRSGGAPPLLDGLVVVALVLRHRGARAAGTRVALRLA